MHAHVCFVRSVWFGLEHCPGAMCLSVGVGVKSNLMGIRNAPTNGDESVRALTEFERPRPSSAPNGDRFPCPPAAVDYFVHPVIERSEGFVALGFARVDIDRDRRQSAPEAILAAGKTPEEVAAIARVLLESGATSVLATRCDPAHRDAMMSVSPDVQWHARARCAWIASNPPAPQGTITIVSAGTSDGNVVHEARIRAELIGTTVIVHEDCGVAGLHRLIPTIPDLESADCVIAVAGMDAALASVVGGLTAAPVIAVPTSTGYGAAFGGVAALLAMLNSCAAGVAVVNIDDGFSAGTIAARIARSAGGASRT